MHDALPFVHEADSRPDPLLPSLLNVTSVVNVQVVPLLDDVHPVFFVVQPVTWLDSHDNDAPEIVPSGLILRIESEIGPHVPFGSSANCTKYVAPGVAHGFACTGAELHAATMTATAMSKRAMIRMVPSMRRTLVRCLA